MLKLLNLSQQGNLPDLMIWFFTKDKQSQLI